MATKRLEDSDISVSVGNEPAISFEGLKQMVSEIEAIAQKGMQRRKKDTEDRCVTARGVSVFYDDGKFLYSVDHYNAQREIVGESEYDSGNLGNGMGVA